MTNMRIERVVYLDDISTKDLDILTTLFGELDIGYYYNDVQNTMTIRLPDKKI